MLHTKKLSWFLVPPNAGEKLLAKRPMLDKRIEIINTNKFVPKKNKIVQGKNQAPSEAGGAPAGMKIRKTPAARRVSTTRKTAGPAPKKTATPRTGKVSMPAEAGRMARPLDEEIRLRAYFISERRRRFALPGDADSDWLEAKRQLVSETGPR
jgi:hypothetical protein